MTDVEQQVLAARLQADFEQGQVWDGAQLQRWIKEQFGKDVSLSRTYEFIRAADFSPQQPRPQHVGGDDAANEAFKTKFEWSSSAARSCSILQCLSGRWINIVWGLGLPRPPPLRVALHLRVRQSRDG
ncbi:winged helix-turn-helix domain-containing protein [Deinococcus sp. SM5_A1]|uniref:helix-turn-helix domain-containing protein n=1 Tax=Deinococcus sp. SM5_A1 TaxID=3379094 RepID=UPI00386C8F5B